MEVQNLGEKRPQGDNIQDNNNPRSEHGKRRTPMSAVDDDNEASFNML